MQVQDAEKLILEELTRRGYRVDTTKKTIEGFEVWFELEPYGDNRLRGKVTGGRDVWETIQNKNPEKDAEAPFYQTMVRHIKMEVDELIKLGVSGVRELHEVMETLGLYSGNPLRIMELFESNGFDPRTGLLVPCFHLEMGKKTCCICKDKKDWYYKLTEPAHYLKKLGLLDGAIGLGYTSLYNHSYRPNAMYRKRYSRRAIEIVARRIIQEGEEITINYNGNPRSQKPIWFTPITETA